MSISPRQQVAENLADTCRFGGLNDSYGVNVAKAKSKSGKEHWGITFAKAAILDGAIEVYSPNFIVVIWQTAIRDLPSRGRELFKSEADAKTFITKTFIM
jgi:hypothetical protein